MPLDASGPATSPDNIPTYDPDADAPSGLGLNAIVAAIQAALTTRIPKPASPADGDPLVYDSSSSTWKRGTDKAVRIAALAGFPNDATKVLKGDGSWAVPSSAASGTWQELGYTEFTSDVSVTSTTEATPDDVVSAGALTFSGQPVVIEFFAPQAQQVNNAELRFSLWEGATNRGKIGAQGAIGNAGGHGPILVRRRIAAPSAGSITFKVSAFNSSAGTGTVKAGSGGSGAFLPGYIRILQKVA